MQPTIDPTLQKTDYTDALNQVIDDFLARQKVKAQVMSPDYQEIWEELERLIHAGGKRLRPRMSILAYRAFGGQDVPSMLPAAAAQELLHVAMLIHDDIIDRDYIRYGVDNIAGSYNKLYSELVTDDAERLHYAQGAAILAGDLLLSGSYLLMAESMVPAEKIIAIQKLLGQAVFEVVGGELLDTETAFRGMNAVSAETVARYKTASYTFILPLLVGARLTDLPSEDLSSVAEFGKNLGIAFQLRDDIIGVFGDEAATGKSTTGDIREGKRTYMVEQFFALATPDQKAMFKQYFGGASITNEQVDTVRKLLVASGALAATEEAVSFYESMARNALETLSIEPDCVDELESLITVATRRTA